MAEQFQCPEGCGFVLRTEDHDEMVELAKQHLARRHDETASESEVDRHVGSVSGA